MGIPWLETAVLGRLRPVRFIVTVMRMPAPRVVSWPLEHPI